MTVQDGRTARIERAAELIAARAYVVAGDAVLVYSDSPGVAGYTVQAGRCTCADSALGFAARNLSGQCKHVCVANAVLAARDLIARRPDLARQIAEGMN